MDGEYTNSVESAGSGTELNVVTIEVKNLGATEDCKVLKFGLSDSWAVVGDDHELAGAGSELLKGELVADLVFA